jgi:hypothetical protein
MDDAVNLRERQAGAGQGRDQRVASNGPRELDPRCGDQAERAMWREIRGEKYGRLPYIHTRKLTRRSNVAAQEPDAHQDELPPILACAQIRVRVSLRGPERGERRV